MLLKPSLGIVKKIVYKEHKILCLYCGKVYHKWLYSEDALGLCIACNDSNVKVIKSNQYGY